MRTFVDLSNGVLVRYSEREEGRGKSYNCDGATMCRCVRVGWVLRGGDGHISAFTSACQLAKVFCGRLMVYR